MSDEFRKNLMGPEPTLLPEEPDVVDGDPGFDPATPDGPGTA